MTNRKLNTHQITYFYRQSFKTGMALVISSIVSRPHKLEWYDYTVGVVWLDVWHELTPNEVAREEKDVGVFMERRR